MEHFFKAITERFGDQEPKVILDVGARDLETSIQFTKRYPNARIIAFEPNPFGFSVCQEKLKGYTNIELHNVACSDEEGVFDFWAVGGNDGCSSLLEPIDAPYSDGTWNKIQVNVSRLDKLLKDLNVDKVDVLWIDVQGVELKSIRGMGAYLDTVDLIHTEASPKPYYKGHILKDELETFLDEQGFDMWFLPANYHPYGEGDLVCVRKQK